jgi:DNA-binding XRE family transcriptional regulator
MPNIAKILREEISRIGRKEAKSACTPLHRKEIKTAKTTVALKKRVVALEKSNRLLLERLAKLEALQPASQGPQEENARAWISGKGIRRLRKKLGLSQAAFAKLVGVSVISVYNWEKNPGMLKLRNTTKASVFSIRDIGAREAKKRLEAMPKSKNVVKKAAKRRKAK